MTGGHHNHNSLSDILVYNPTSGHWDLTDHMIQPRSYHAVSTVHWQHVADFCQE